MTPKRKPKRTGASRHTHTASSRPRRPRRQFAPTGDLGIALEPQAVAIEPPVNLMEAHEPGHHFDLFVQDARGRWIEVDPADIPPWRGDPAGDEVSGDVGQADAGHGKGSGHDTGHAGHDH